MKSGGLISAKRRVFLVDDHPLVREWLASLVALETDLEVCGQAEDAHTAVIAVPLAEADIVVIDLSLPSSSGLELIKDLRAQFPALKLLVLSMHDEASVAERAFRAGANGYAAKRDSGPKIIEGIRAVLEGKFYASTTLTAELAGRMFGGTANTGTRPDELLSDREIEVFRLRGQGHNTKKIAEFLRVSVKTIESYDARIKSKLGLQNAGELLREAVRWTDRKTGV